MDIIIDSHCHPQFPQYDHDREEMIKRSLDGGVKMICVGTDLKTSREAVVLADRYEGLWASVGIHPNDDDEVNDDYESLAKHPKVVAIGEIGLDYYRSSDKKEIQRIRFEKQFGLAQKMGKPVIIHCRDAHEDMLFLLPQNVLGVMHSFNDSYEIASRYIDRGMFIGLNAIVTFSDNYKEMVRQIPLNRLLLETDAPYLSPSPYRGKRNEPLYIIETAKLIANIRNITLKKLIDQTTKNAHTLFNIY